MTSQTQQCNMQACEKDCVLSTWSRWSACSKDCDGGTRKRTKYVKEMPEGAGTCPSQWDSERLQYKQCNKFKCLTKAAKDCSNADDDARMYTCDTLPPCC